MCLVKVKGEVEDDVIVPARVVDNHDHHHVRETQIVETAPTVVERLPPPRPRSHRYASSSSSSSSSSRSSRSTASYDHRRDRRRRNNNITDDGSSHDGRSSYRSGRSRSRDRGYYSREHERVVSGSSYRGDDGGMRSSYRYVDPQPRGNPQPRGSSNEVRQEIIRAEEHLQRAAELQERDRRARGTRQIAYDPRSSSASHRSYEQSRDGSRRRSEVVVVQEERHRDRYSSR